ncbi:MAG: hypothetical protein ACFFDF_22500, partial [Candidatus Odinarchaeota archaeon]
MPFDIIYEMTFEIIDRDAAGRICKFETKHGTVTSPNLLPVVNPNKILLSPQEMPCSIEPPEEAIHSLIKVA